MKKLAAFIVIVIMTILRALGAQNYPATGRVVTQQGDAVEFATVVLLQDGQQTAGTATDTEGRFALKVPAGDYTLSIRFIGFEPLEREVRIESPTDLGDLTLSAAATQIDDVVVSAQLIRREADRFVVDVANTPAMLGRDGIEALKLAPGIWMDGDKISINGKSGSKVYVNDRELRMEPDQLLSYLQSLRAEDIQKIEVIPMAGADYDADSSGGVIRITLRKRREQGTEGSVSLAAQAGEWSHGLKPQASVNHHSERFDFYANAWGHLQNATFRSDELTRYTAGDTRLESHSRTKERPRNYGFKAGGICELTPKHSIGLEADYWRTNEPGINDTHTDFTAAGIPTRTESRYDAHNRQNNLSATFNYIFKLDTAGSTLKLLADYNLRSSDSGNDNSSRIASPGGTLDSLYRNRSTAHYNVATATLALDKHFGPKWTLRAGAKYTYNDMRNHALYEYRPAETWLRDEAHSFRLDYTEHIAAVYGIVAANLGRWSAVAGLRGEYTRTAGKNDGTRQDYFFALPQRQRLLCAHPRRRLLAHRPVCPHHRTAALLVSQSAARADFGLHLSDGQPGARTLLQTRCKPDPGAGSQIYAHGRRDGPDRRNPADHTARPDQPRHAANRVGQLRHDEKLLRFGQHPAAADPLVVGQPQRNLHPPRPAHRPEQPRRTLQFRLCERLDDLHPAGEVLHRPLLPLPEPRGAGQLLGRRDALHRRRHQETLRRQSHGCFHGTQPHSPTDSENRSPR